MTNVHVRHRVQWLGSGLHCSRSEVRIPPNPKKTPEGRFKNFFFNFFLLKSTVTILCVCATNVLVLLLLLAKMLSWSSKHSHSHSHQLIISMFQTRYQLRTPLLHLRQLAVFWPLWFYIWLFFRPLPRRWPTPYTSLEFVRSMMSVQGTHW